MKIKYKTITLSEKKYRRLSYLGELQVGEHFLNGMYKCGPKRNIIGKMNYIILANFCSSKATIKRVIEQSMQWKMIFTMYTSNKEF